MSKAHQPPMNHPWRKFTLATSHESRMRSQVREIRKMKPLAELSPRTGHEYISARKLGQMANMERL